MACGVRSGMAYIWGWTVPLCTGQQANSMQQWEEQEWPKLIRHDDSHKEISPRVVHICFDVTFERQI